MPDELISTLQEGEQQEPKHETIRNGNTEKSGVAMRAQLALGHEIEELNDDEITAETAPIIIGMYLSRDIETRYLSAFAAEDLIARGTVGMNSKGATDDVAAQWRTVTGELHQVLTEMNKGNYEPLKIYSLQKATEFRRRGFHSQLIGQVFKLAADRMPNQGLPIKTLAPAWMEEPIPLREQLRQLQKQQGGNR
ncbi:MAG: hypothetical protein HYU48_01520 [Candidatus Levybacteria bacterium]|nr:hypothetical protein [Candidatus Levybacteria bacterium]